MADVDIDAVAEHLPEAAAPPRSFLRSELLGPCPASLSELETLLCGNDESCSRLPQSSHSQPLNSSGQPLNSYDQPSSSHRQPLNSYDQPSSSHRQPLNPYPALREAVRVFDDRFSLNGPGTFSAHLLPSIWQWAREAVDLFSMPAVLHTSSFPDGSSSRTSYTARTARHILANAFLLNVDEALESISPLLKVARYRSIDFAPLYREEYSSVGVERTLALLVYFYQMRDASNVHLERLITVEKRTSRDLLRQPDWASSQVRINSTNVLQPAWTSSQVRINSINVFVNTGKMEEYENAAFVNFANRLLHIHQVIPSATQEEILFSACPEMFVAILYSPETRDDQVVRFTGVKRFIEYTGFRESFKVSGIFGGLESGITEVVSLDAVAHNHFKLKNVNRDIAKAYTGFSSCERAIISSGQWGCGAFGGDPDHKFLQQVIAAAMAGKQLAISTFGRHDLLQRHCELLDAIDGKTVSQVYNSVIRVDESWSRTESYKDAFLAEFRKTIE